MIFGLHSASVFLFYFWCFAVLKLCPSCPVSSAVGVDAVQLFWNDVPEMFYGWRRFFFYHNDSVTMETTKCYRCLNSSFLPKCEKAVESTLRVFVSCSFLTLFLLLTPVWPKCSTNELHPVSTSAVRTTTSKQAHSYFLQVHWTLQRTDERNSCVGVACVSSNKNKKTISEKFLSNSF